MVVVPLGDSAVLAELGSASGADLPQTIRAFSEALAAGLLDGVYDIVPAFTTVTVHYDAIRVGGEDPEQKVETWLRSTFAVMGPIEATKPREFILPVCYGGDFGTDLPLIANHAKLTEQEVVTLHCGATYTVRAIGFSPGFPYLEGLPSALECARRATPRTRVPAGSVAIAGLLSAVYPQATPGGWNLIGRTPKRLFSLEPEPSTLLRVGDRVQFRPIEAAQFAEQEGRP